MHRKPFSFGFVLLAAFLFCWVNLPRHISDELRCFSTASLSPVWGGLKKVKIYLADRPGSFRNPKKETEEVLRLQLENIMLRKEVEKLSSWLVSEERVGQLLEQAKKIEEESFRSSDTERRAFLNRRLKYLLSLLTQEMQAVPAQVIYRDPSCWSSSLWVDVGEDDNQTLGKMIVAKNSPVVIGSALVGVVDYVGRKQARIRLITDSGLSPAVRSVRGDSQNRECASLIGDLLLRLKMTDRNPDWVQSLAGLKKELESAGYERYLAKGELHGSGAPLWRGRSTYLKGIGFNFDYPDEEGACPKDLPILKKGDLLVTSGLDGVFPPDLQVGIVTCITSPKPGGYAYEVEVHPVASHLREIETVFILPPRGGD